MKVSRIAAVALAAHLFELEVESIGNDPEFHFQFNGWLDKFGDGSLKHEDQLTSDATNQFNAQAIEKIADEIQADYESGHWIQTEDGLYKPAMTTEYGGYIVDALEKQLAMLTGAGVQEELFS